MPSSPCRAAAGADVSTWALIGYGSGAASDEMKAANKELTDANKRLSALNGRLGANTTSRDL